MLEHVTIIHTYTRLQTHLQTQAHVPAHTHTHICTQTIHTFVNILTHTPAAPACLPAAAGAALPPLLLGFLLCGAPTEQTEIPHAHKPHARLVGRCVRRQLRGGAGAQRPGQQPVSRACVFVCVCVCVQVYVSTCVHIYICGIVLGCIQ